MEDLRKSKTKGNSEHHKIKEPLQSKLKGNLKNKSLNIYKHRFVKETRTSMFKGHFETDIQRNLTLVNKGPLEIEM